jgi:hypothetical protein
MVCVGSVAVRRLRAGFVAVACALTLVACGQASSTGSGSASNSATSSASSTGGSGTSTPSDPGTPAISGTPPASVVAGQSYTFTPTAFDASGAALTFTAANLPPWASFSNGSGQVSGTPTAASVGTFANIQITVSNGQASATLPAFSITVVAPLALSGTPAASVTVGSGYSFQPTSSAPPGTVLTFSVQNLPAWASFDASTGRLAGTPTQTGSFPGILIAATDGVQSSALPAFTITVTSPAGPNSPTIAGTPATSVTAGSLYSFTPTASGPSGTLLTFSVQNLPVWASFNPASGTLSGSPTSAQVGSYAGILISVSAGTLSASLPPFSIKVVAPLTISGAPATQVAAGKSYAFQPTTNAPAGSALTFSIQNRPVWATFNATSGLLSGTPTASQIGSYGNIVISVSDGTQSVALAPFAVNVVSALTISGSPPAQVVVGNSYSFQPATNAASGTALTFSIQNKPAWASFSASNGALSGTPSASQAGTYSNIAISVSNGTQSAALAAFTITVSNPAKPTISGNPSTAVNVGSKYAFTPTASGPSGTTLTFGVQNLPGWASFNTANGTLSGTPGAANAGSYSNIVISVSDGSASASLPAFSISVNQVSNGSVTLSWTAVTKNTNGSALTDLAGYRLYYGTSANAMNTVVVLANPAMTTYVVGNLSSGTWYFGIAAYTTTGVDSAMSNVGSTTIN